MNKPKLAALFQGCSLALLLCVGTAVSQAGTSTGQFAVNITLTGAGIGTAGVHTSTQSAPGVCISQTLSQQTSALVRVACSTGQFVSITANSASRFLGTHGGAFRFVSSQGSLSFNPQLAGSELPNYFYPGTGTVTAWRIVNVDGSDGPFEVLLTF